VSAAAYARRPATNQESAAALGLPSVNPALFDPGRASPATLHKLPVQLAAPVVHAYSQSLAARVLGLRAGLVGRVRAVVVPQEVPLRGTARAASPDIGDVFAMPRVPDADQNLARAAGQLLSMNVGRCTAPCARFAVDEARSVCGQVASANDDTRSADHPVAEGCPRTGEGCSTGVRPPIEARASDVGPGGAAPHRTGEDDFGTLAAAWQYGLNTDASPTGKPEPTVDLPAAKCAAARGRLFD